MLSDYLLRKPVRKNQIDDMVDGLVNVMRYSDPLTLYPSNAEDVKPNEGVDAEWFYPIFNDSNSFSELSAIHMYTTQEAVFEEIGQLMLGIALVEMQHYGKLADLICSLGGTIERSYSDSEVEIGKTPEEALKIAIDGEVTTIDFYDKVAERIQKSKQTKTTQITLQMIAKIRSDEVVHLSLLRKKLEKYGSKEK